MTYCATYPGYTSAFDRRPLFRDFLSQAGFGLVTVAFIGAAGACLIFARPGGTVRVAKAPEITTIAKVRPGKTVPAQRIAAAKPRIELQDVMFSLDFAPLSLAESAPRGANFEAFSAAVQVASVASANIAPVPVPPATDIAENVPVPARRPADLSRTPAATRTAQANPAPTTPAEASSIFDRLFGTKTEQPPGPVLAYANPEDGALRTSPGAATNAVAPAYDKFTAVYDISARTVYLPNGTKLEAHSGLREYLDDPGHVHVRMRGATPPATYELKLRESLFHGVRALRLTPIDSNVYGRDGLLAHTYMLGPRGDSNGCVSFRNYDAFLQAFLRGDVKRLAVVAKLN